MRSAPASQGCPVVSVIADGPYHNADSILSHFPKAQPKFRASNDCAAVELDDLTSVPINLVDTVAERMAQVAPHLWLGRWSRVKRDDGSAAYPSQSEADLALAKRIAPELAAHGLSGAVLQQATKAVFDRSALAHRPKWNRADYCQRTIQSACQGIVATSLNALTRATVDWSLYGDVRNARYFAALFSGTLLYIYGLKQWFIWKDDRWQRCEQGEEIEKAKEAVQAMLAEASACLNSNPEQGERRIKETAGAYRLPRLKAALELAQSEPGMSVKVTDLDSDPCLTGVANGVVDLKTGRLMANRPGLHITRHCDAKFDQGATCPRFLQFLHEVFGSDQATIDAVQLLLGYTLTGLTTEEIMIFCVGFGANGKSILGNVVNAVMGEYAKTAPPSLLASRRVDDHGPRNDLAMLDGVRLVSINELPGGMLLDEQMVKQIAGRELISARRLYGEFFSYQPRATAWVRTNHKPIIKGDDDGIWRRIVILPFKQKFEGRRRDPHLEAKLLAERDGILRWMVEGAQKYLKHGLSLSPAMLAEQRRYRTESDMLGEFLTDCTAPDPAGRVLDAELFGRWRYWCDGVGSKTGTKTTFTQRLAERGYAITRSNGKRYYSGLKLML